MRFSGKLGGRSAHFLGLQIRPAPSWQVTNSQNYVLLSNHIFVRMGRERETKGIGRERKRGRERGA